MIHVMSVISMMNISMLNVSMIMIFVSKIHGSMMYRDAKNGEHYELSRLTLFPPSWCANCSAVYVHRFCNCPNVCMMHISMSLDLLPWWMCLWCVSIRFFGAPSQRYFPSYWKAVLVRFPKWVSQTLLGEGLTLVSLEKVHKIACFLPLFLEPFWCSNCLRLCLQNQKFSPKAKRSNEKKVWRSPHQRDWRIKLEKRLLIWNGLKWPCPILRLEVLWPRSSVDTSSGTSRRLDGTVFNVNIQIQLQIKTDTDTDSETDTDTNKDTDLLSKSPHKPG